MIIFAKICISTRYKDFITQNVQPAKKYMYEGFETKSDSMWAGYGIAVTFEF